MFADLRKLQSQCEELLFSGENSDVTIQVKGKKFNCHKSVLAKNSPVFADMFANMKKDYVLESDCVEPDVFHQFLLYLYTSSGKYLSWENCTRLFLLGEVFDVHTLMELCKAKWEEHLLKVTFSYEQWILDRGVPAEKVYIFMDALRKDIKIKTSETILIKNPYILVDIIVEFVENHNCNKVKPIQRMSKPDVPFQ